jgi:DNA-binding transcriptional LysR family regulator
MELACVMREQMMLAIPEGHALAKGKAPALRDLERAPFIMYSPTEGRYFYDLTSGILRAAEIEPSYVQHVSEVHTALALVSARAGVALVPAAARNLLVRGVVLREFEPAPRTQAELHLIWRRRQDNPAFVTFRNLVLPKLVDF